MKNHLKRIASPRTWLIERKALVFVTRPKPGAHSLEYGLPLGMIIRDALKLSSTMSEVKKLLNNNEVLIDGKRRKDHRFIVGLFDVITIPSIKKYCRIVLDKKGRVIVTEIPEKESNIKPCKIVNKTVLPKGKIQFNLHDGKNIIVDQKAKVGDSLILELPSLKIQKVIPLKPGVSVFLIGGRLSGNLGVLKEIKDNEATYVADSKEIETAKRYLFAVGEKKPEITFNTDNTKSKE